MTHKLPRIMKDRATDSKVRKDYQFFFNATDIKKYQEQSIVPIERLFNNETQDVPRLSL